MLFPAIETKETKETKETVATKAFYRVIFNIIYLHFVECFKL
jgi:hypothetical protein